VEPLDNKDHNRLYKITQLLKTEKNAVKLLSVIKDEALTREDIVTKSGLSPIQCHRIMRKLRELGLIKLVKSAQAEGSSEPGTFLYQAQLNPDFIRFENGRFKLRFPEVLSLPGNEEIEVRTLFEDESKE
jgi:transcription initiation factor IIE alpha subunit